MVDISSINNVKMDDMVERVKGLFGIKNSSVIGLDIGLSAVKMAEVEVSGNNFKLVRFAKVMLPEGTLIEDEIQRDEDLKAAIEEAYRELGSKNKQVCIGFFGQNSVVRKIQLPGGTPDEIEDQVVWEAEQYLPFPVDESYLDQFILGENEGGGVDVVVAAVRKELLTNYKDLVESTGLKVKIADIGALAISNVFELAYSDFLEKNQHVSWLLIDFGAQKTTCVIYKNNSPIFIKELPVGGIMITEEVQRKLGVNFNEAEDLKIIVDENGNVPEEIKEIIDDMAQKFVEEIKKMVDFYQNSTSDDSLTTCFITGGNQHLVSLIDLISQNLGMEIEIINPFKVIEVSKNFSDEDIQYIAHCGVVALGLAMRQVK